MQGQVQLKWVVPNLVVGVAGEALPPVASQWQLQPPQQEEDQTYSKQSQLKRQSPFASGTVGEVCLNNGGMPCVVVGLSLEIMPAIESNNYARKGEAAKHGKTISKAKPPAHHCVDEQMWWKGNERHDCSDCRRFIQLKSISVLFELTKPINLGPFNIIFYGTSTTSCPVAAQSNGCWRQGQCASLLGSWMAWWFGILSDSILSNEETTSGNLSRIHFAW